MKTVWLAVDTHPETNWYQQIAIRVQTRDETRIRETISRIGARLGGEVVAYSLDGDVFEWKWLY